MVFRLDNQYHENFTISKPISPYTFLNVSTVSGYFDAERFVTEVLEDGIIGDFLVDVGNDGKRMGNSFLSIALNVLIEDMLNCTTFRGRRNYRSLE